jgi:tetratricopeptide (TPR) repeat protein
MVEPMWRMTHRVAIAMAVLGLLAVVIWIATRRPTPSPPVPGDLGAFDPGLADVIRQAIERVRQEPRDIGRRVQLGMVYEANQLQALAEETYRQTAALAPDDARIWYRLAYVSDRLGHIDEALAAAQQAAAADERYPPAQWRLGDWLLDAGRIDEAQAAFERAVRLDGQDPAGWYGLARVALQRNEADAAVKIVRERLLDGPAAGRGYQLLGRAYSALGRTDDARHALARADGSVVLWNDPWTREVSAFVAGTVGRREMAGRYFRQGDYLKAIEILEGLLDEQPDDVTLLNQLGLAYATTGRPAKSRTVLERSLEINPESFQAHYYLADAISKDPRATTWQLERGLHHIDRAIELNPMSSVAHLTKAVLLYRRGVPPQAARAFKQAFALDARNPGPLIDAGFIECDLRRWADALATFERALARDPGRADAHVGHAIALMELGRLDEAEIALGRAEALDPADRRQLSMARERLKGLVRRP